MNIKKLHIYGFGKFYDIQIDLLSSNLQVIFGENEKGKSTIKTFITTILFGFPTRAQAGAHYEPKQGTKYGGQIIIDINGLSEITIERQKGKNGGKAIIYYEDGTIGGEEALNQLLGGMDKGLFTGVFSFSASDLQKMEQLKTDELNRYLHGASIWGKGSLNELEKKIEKGQQDLFKPSGKKPILNEKLQQLEVTRYELKEMEGQLKQYDELLSQRINLRKQQQGVNNTVTGLKDKLKIQEKLILMDPLYRKEKSVLSQLEQLPSVNHFPLHGIDQVKDSITKERALKEQFNDLEVKMTELKKQLKELTLRPDFGKIKEQAVLIKEMLYEYERLKEELTSLQLELRKLEQLIIDQKGRLGKEWNDDLILQTQTSLTAKEELKKLTQRERKSDYEREQIEIELKTKLLKLEQTKQTLKDITSECLSSEYQLKLQQQIDQAKADRSRRQELEQKIQWLNGQSKDALDYGNTRVFKIIAIALLVISGWLLYIQQWIPSILTFVFAIIMMYVSGRPKGRENKQHHQQLVEYEKELEGIKTTDDLEREIGLIERDLKENMATEHQLEVWNKQWTQEEREYNLLVGEIETCENEIQLIVNQLVLWCDKHQFVHYGSCEHQLELFDVLVEVKQNMNNKNYYKKRREEIHERMELINEIGQQLAAKLKIDQIGSLSVLVHKITETVEREQQKKIQFNEVQKNIKMVASEVETLKRKIQYLQEERSNWILKAHAKDEEEFFYFADVATERQTLEKELLILRSQQAQFTLEPLTKEQVKIYLDQASVSIEEELQTLTKQLKQAEAEQSLLENQIGRIEQEIEQLETGNNHSQLRQTYEIKKEEFQSVAKEWATFRISHLILNKAKSIYETERQPVVIQKAKELFSIMTNREYVNLFAPVSESSFIVERSDGMRFTPDELSQGTGEQLYLSLRLALALAYQAPSPMPIILDDIMVNFDDGRKVSAIRVIKEVAKKHQVLFFTCHEQIKDLFDLEATMVLS
ncbi:ATP-binding protein [Alkalihalobacterium alkalinitrilicum]|uniref:ATP-binding protein n=1 Tax=Alkalihalobacterium alkalinitrilicum TaxID=427920 RepID=UPI001303D54C|nr:AAA family ATPase [Alkalihalobacterium alkalinitrilicum]